MSQIEVRRGTKRVWIPGFNHLAPKSALVCDAVRVRRNVNRLRVRIVEVELHSVGHSLFQASLQGVVIGSTDRAPRIQGCELRVYKAVRPAIRIIANCGISAGIVLVRIEKTPALVEPL